MLEYDSNGVSEDIDTKKKLMACVSVLFASNGTFSRQILGFNQNYAMAVMIQQKDL